MSDRWSEAFSDAFVYADFEEVGDVTRARKFITNARRLLLFPTETRRGSVSHRDDRAFIAAEIRRAQDYIQANDDALPVIHFDLSEAGASG